MYYIYHNINSKKLVYLMCQYNISKIHNYHMYE